MQQLLEQDGPVRREHDPDLEAAAGPRGRASFDEAMFLPSDAPLSDHPDLDASAAANTAMRSVTGAFADAAITMHPVTGAFADPSHETAFAAHLFRLAFPCHAFLMSLLLGLTIWTTLGAPAELSSVFVWRVIVPILALGLVGRVLVHRMHDTVRGQRIGSWAWMALVVLANTADMCGFLNAPAVGCAQSSKAAALLPLLYLATALTNGTHGLGFVLKAALIGLVLVTCFFAIAVCGEAGLVLMLIAMVPMTIVGFVLAHMAEVHLRHSYVEKQRLEERNDEESRRLEERNEQLQAEKERLLYDVQRRGRPLDDGDDRSAIRRGLQGPSQPYHRADSTNSSDTRAPDPSDSPLPSMPPGPPSSSERESGKSGQDTGDSSRAVHGKSTPPPPTWAELDAQFYAERAAESAAEQEVPAGAPPSTAGAQPRSAGRSKALPPPSWAELAYRRFYAERAAQSSIIEQGVPPPMGQPPTWAELGAEPDRQWLEDRALVVALVASNSSAAEVTSGQEVVEEMVTEMATQEEGAASTGTLTFEETMAQLQRAIWLADRPSQEVWIARCSARIATDSSSTRPSSQEVPIQINRVTPAIALQQRFDALVMCNFTPRSPRELPKPQWVSYQTLFDLFQPHAETEVWRTGPNNLRQRIVEWYKVHPAFAGLKSSAWCKRLSAVDPQDGSSYVYKFCFQHTPRGEAKGSEP